MADDLIIACNRCYWLLLRQRRRTGCGAEPQIQGLAEPFYLMPPGDTEWWTL